MTPDPEREAVLQRARGVLKLYRGAVGGERQAAAGALRRLLDRHGLYLDALEPGLPRSRDLSDLDGWTPRAGLLAQLDGPDQDAALAQLIEDAGLSVAERRAVLERLSLGALVASRAEGWLHAAADPELTPPLLTQAAAALDQEALAADPAPIAESVRRLSLQAAWTLARPPRRLTAESDVQAEYLAGLVEAVSGRRARVQYPGSGPDGQRQPGTVTAGLSAGELSRVRALAASGQQRLERELRAAARRVGREGGQ